MVILSGVRIIYFEKQKFYQLSEKTILYCEHCNLKVDLGTSGKCEKYRLINGQCGTQKYPVSKDWYTIKKMFKRRF